MKIGGCFPISWENAISPIKSEVGMMDELSEDVGSREGRIAHVSRHDCYFILECESISQDVFAFYEPENIPTERVMELLGQQVGAIGIIYSYGGAINEDGSCSMRVDEIFEI